jgi:hypothetical protein
MGLDERLSRAFRRTPGPAGVNDASDPDKPAKIPGSPGTVGGNPEKLSKQQIELRASLEKVDKMIQGGRAAGLVHAAKHLEHWRNGSGRKLIMPASAFDDQEFIKSWLKKTVWPKFVEGTKKRVNSGELKAGGSINMYWIDSLYAHALTDLYFALGGFTIRSDVVVSAESIPDSEGGGLVFRFEKWECRASDRYNWDLLKSTVIPGIGRVEDEELRTLERHGYGKMFDIESEVWQFDDLGLMREFTF